MHSVNINYTDQHLTFKNNSKTSTMLYNVITLKRVNMSKIDVQLTNLSNMR